VKSSIDLPLSFPELASFELSIVVLELDLDHEQVSMKRVQREVARGWFVGTESVTRPRVRYETLGVTSNW
jgi:hypothetical protein